MIVSEKIDANNSFQITLSPNNSLSWGFIEAPEREELQQNQKLPKSIMTLGVVHRFGWWEKLDIVKRRLGIPFSQQKC